MRECHSKHNKMESSKRKHSVPVTEEMQGLLDQFETKSIQTSLNQLEQDVTPIKTSLEKKKPKVSLADLSAKIDIILEYIGRSA